jgi:hypothetical protein
MMYYRIERYNDSKRTFEYVNCNREVILKNVTENLLNSIENCFKNDPAPFEIGCNHSNTKFIVSSFDYDGNIN